MNKRYLIFGIMISSSVFCSGCDLYTITVKKKLEENLKKYKTIYVQEDLESDFTSTIRCDLRPFGIKPKRPNLRNAKVEPGDLLAIVCTTERPCMPYCGRHLFPLLIDSTKTANLKLIDRMTGEILAEADYKRSLLWEPSRQFRLLGKGPITLMLEEMIGKETIRKAQEEYLKTL